MGVPVHAGAHQMSPAALTSLAGEGVHLASLSSVLLAIFFDRQAPWWTQSEGGMLESSDDEQDSPPVALQSQSMMECPDSPEIVVPPALKRTLMGEEPETNIFQADVDEGTSHEISVPGQLEADLEALMESCFPTLDDPRLLVGHIPDDNVFPHSQMIIMEAPPECVVTPSEPSRALARQDSCQSEYVMNTMPTRTSAEWRIAYLGDGQESDSSLNSFYGDAGADEAVDSSDQESD